MSTNLQINDRFPDASLPDHRYLIRRLSDMTRPSALDLRLDFQDGYPLIVVFYRGHFCPRDQAQMRQLVRFQEELQVNSCQLVCISVESPRVQAAFRAGLGARWPFLSDEKRELVNALNILDETEGEVAYPAQPYTFVLRPNLTVFSIYNGWWFVGRPTLEELRQDCRAIMQASSHYDYAAYNTSHVKQIRIPQQEWQDGAPPLGASGLPRAEGIVATFDLARGTGTIESDQGQPIFFHFTAIPGQGYRTVKPGTAVAFEVVQTKTGLVARNLQRL